MNHTYNIFPFKGISIVNFKDSRQEVRQKCGDGLIIRGEVDFYKDLGLFFEFEDDRCCHIEILSSNDVFFESQNLTAMSFDNLRNMFDYLSCDIDEEVGFGVNYLDLGFGASLDAGNKGVKTISLFTKTYWDN